MNYWNMSKIDLITLCIRLDEKNKHLKGVNKGLRDKINQLLGEIDELNDNMDRELYEPNYIHEI